MSINVDQIILGLEYLNAKNLVHTQIGASAVFVNERCAIKLGSFLHARRIGSLRWNFTGHPSRLPPEAFIKQSDQTTQLSRTLRVKPNFDTWLVLEINIFV